MAYSLPENGEPLWGDKVNGSLEALRGLAESAVADSTNAVSTAIEARAVAQATKEFVEAPTDGQIAAKIEDPESETAAALTASIADGVEVVGPDLFAAHGGALNATLRKLADEVGDVRVLVIGDSTASVGYWPDYLWPAVQAQYPHRTLRKAQWDFVSAYGALTQVGSAGTPGTAYIDWYQGAEGGTVYESLYATWEARIAAVQPDLVIVNYGHNYGKDAASGGQPSDAVMDHAFLVRTMRFIADVKKSLPHADVLIASQNPYLTAGARPGMSDYRAQAMRRVASEMGCAYGPILEAFRDTGNPSAYLNVDLLHPNTAGAQLGAAALLPMFRPAPNYPPGFRSESQWNRSSANLLVNGDFSDFAAPPTLPSWTALLSTLSKETTNYETGTWALKIAAAAGSGQGQAYQGLSAAALRRARGNLITVAARFYLPAGLSPASCARVQITGDGVTTATSPGLANGRDRFIWEIAQTRVPATSTFVTVSLQGGSAGSSDYCFVDRVVAVAGGLPRDMV